MVTCIYSWRTKFQSTLHLKNNMALIIQILFHKKKLENIYSGNEPH